MSLLAVGREPNRSSSDASRPHDQYQANNKHKRAEDCLLPMAARRSGHEIAGERAGRRGRWPRCKAGSDMRSSEEGLPNVITKGGA